MKDDGTFELLELEHETDDETLEHPERDGALELLEPHCAGAARKITSNVHAAKNTATEPTEKHWLRCRKLLEDYRTHCVECRAYTDAAEATSRLEELQEHHKSWRRDMLAARCLQERRSLGAKQQQEYRDFAQTWELQFSAFREKAINLREDLRERHILDMSGQGPKRYGFLGSELPPGWDEESQPCTGMTSADGGGEDSNDETSAQQEGHEELADAEEWEEEDEEEQEEGDEEADTSQEAALEVLMQCAYDNIHADDHYNDMDAAGNETGTRKLVTDPTLKIPPQITSMRRVRSARSMELRHKAKKLATLQRYAEAAELQAEAEREEDYLYGKKLKELAVTKEEGEERQLQEMHRLDGRLRDEEMSLQKKKQKDEQFLFKRHARIKEQLVSKQLKAWRALGGKNTQLEKVLCQLARPRSCDEAVKTRTAPQRIAVINQKLESEQCHPRQSRSTKAIRCNSSAALPSSRQLSAKAKGQVSANSRPASAVRCSSSASLPSSRPHSAIAKGPVSASSRPASAIRCSSSASLPSSRPHSAMAKGQVSATSRPSSAIHSSSSAASPSSRPQSAAAKEQVLARARPASAIRCSSSSALPNSTKHSAMPKGQVSASGRPASAAARHRDQAISQSKSKDQTRNTLPVADANRVSGTSSASRVKLY